MGLNMAKWAFDDIPDQTGKYVVVTGANSGLGFETTKAMAAKGATVVMACRNEEKAAQAASAIRDTVPNAPLEVRKLDLSDQDSITAFADEMLTQDKPIDVLFNNAGVMAMPEMRTAQGFEMQVGTNHLGHFAVAARLFPLVEKAEAGRVVAVASQAHRIGKISLDDLNWQSRSYSRWSAYGQAKLANLMFSKELAKRLTAKNSKVISAAAHPGYASTNLQSAASKVENSKFGEWFFELGNSLLGQSQTMGALPSLRAATDPAVTSGDYYGPHGFMERAGYPVKVGSTKIAQDEDTWAKLWTLSEDLVGVKFDV